MNNQNKTLVAGKFKLSEVEENYIRNTIALLPHKERLAIYFLFWEQRTFLSIAFELGVSVGDVSCLISDAMKKLRPQLAHIADNYFGINNSEVLELVA